MDNPWFATLLAVFIISLLSLVGIFTLSISAKAMKSILIYMVSFAAGALLGDTFLHILPHVGSDGFSIQIGLAVLSGLLAFFVLEKFIHWQHCHLPTTEDHPHAFTYMNLVGDGFHNLIDGMLVAGGFMVSFPLGISTAIAVALHEIPQEIGDFAVLLHGGFSRKKALLANFATALTAVVGAVFILIVGHKLVWMEWWLPAFTAGAFIYIATADLIPELHKDTAVKKSAIQIVTFLMGVGVMALMLLVHQEGGH